MWCWARCIAQICLNGSELSIGELMGVVTLNIWFLYPEFELSANDPVSFHQVIPYPQFTDL
jgi:hypothetical protein